MAELVAENSDVVGVDSASSSSDSVPSSGSYISDEDDCSFSVEAADSMEVEDIGSRGCAYPVRTQCQSPQLEQHLP